MKTLLRFITALTFAAGLAGCGGDDNDGVVSPTPTPVPNPGGEKPEPAPTPDTVSLSLLGRYATGVFDESAAEIPAFHPGTQRIFIVNAQEGVVDVLDASQPHTPEKVHTLDVDDVAEGATVNSVAVYQNLLAVAVEAAEKTEPGYVVLFSAEDLRKISHVRVGSLPDMLTFTPDGKSLLVANEGEPCDDYSVDPEGSISIIDLSDVNAPSVETADFRAWNGREQELRDEGLRIYGPNASAAQDFEPEYIALSDDGLWAFATLQENNALARIHVSSATVTDIFPMGYRDHGEESLMYGAGAGLDPSDDDGAINIRTWPGVRGMYNPDAIGAFTAGGQTYLVTANEGDARAWGEGSQGYWDGDSSLGFVEEIRVKHLVHPKGFERRVGDDMPPQLPLMAAGALLNPVYFGYCGASPGDAGACRDDENLGRLNVTWTRGYQIDDAGQPVMYNASGERDPAGDRIMYDELYAFGTRSFSIWSSEGDLVWDSRDSIEQFLASEGCRLGTDRSIPCHTFFNANHTDGDSFESRSDNKGPEPEGLTLGRIGDKTFLFLGLERMGGILTYDVTDPTAVDLVDYINTRDNWNDDPEEVLESVGDLGPEGLIFVSAGDSPNGEPLLIVGNEVSGTTAIYQVNQGVEE